MSTHGLSKAERAAIILTATITYGGMLKMAGFLITGTVFLRERHGNTVLKENSITFTSLPKNNLT